MSPVKDHTCLDLVFDFPHGCTHWDMDLDHIKTKVMTHRSNHSCEIGVDASCYYEAAKTLLSILNLFYISEIFRNPFSKPFSQIRLTISPENCSGVPFVKLLATSEFPESRYKNIKRAAIITMMYSNADTIKNEDGIFAIKVGLMTPEYNFKAERVLGDVNAFMAEYVEPNSPAWEFLNPRGDDHCWVAGPVLKYSENFPAPSVMIGHIKHVFAELSHQYDEWEIKLKEACDAANADMIAPATCVAGWTKLMTDEGEKEIRQLAGNVVRAWNGQVYSVVTVEELDDDQPCLIITFNNNKQLFVSRDHTFIMSNGFTRLASELSVNDCLAAWVNPSGQADVVSVTEIQEGPVLGKVYHVLDPLQHKAMYNGIITVD